MILWGANDTHPARTRLTCLEVLGLIMLTLLGWIAALWFDSALREARALKNPAVQEAR